MGERAISLYNSNGDSLWSIGQSGVTEYVLLANSRGFVTFEYNRARLISSSGNTLAIRDGIGRLRTAISTLNNRTVLVSEYPAMEMMVLDSNLELVGSQPISEGVFALAASSSGEIFVCVRISSNTINLLKFSDSGVLVDEREHSFPSTLRWMGNELVVVSDSVLCLWTKHDVSGNTRRYVNFCSEDLDSLGRMEIEYNIAAMRSDDSGNLVVSSTSGQNLMLALYSTYQLTPIPPSIELLVEGPPAWGYRMRTGFPAYDKLTLNNVSGLAMASVSGEAAENWITARHAHQVEFSAASAQSLYAAVDTFWLGSESCNSGPLSWSIGNEIGIISDLILLQLRSRIFTARHAVREWRFLWRYTRIRAWTQSLSGDLGQAITILPSCSALPR
ncbi:MAG: hypothetical protein IPP40_13960 [bacterium]|nr:hypothetical protein [bacterium]